MTEYKRVFPEHHERAFEMCCKNGFTRQQALIMANGFDKRNLIEASTGCTHYLLVLTCRGIK